MKNNSQENGALRNWLNEKCVKEELSINCCEAGELFNETCSMNYGSQLYLT